MGQSRLGIARPSRRVLVAELATGKPGNLAVIGGTIRNDVALTDAGGVMRTRVGP